MNPIFDRQRILSAHQRWLEKFNPIRGLDMQKLASLFADATEGGRV